MAPAGPECVPKASTEWLTPGSLPSPGPLQLLSAEVPGQQAASHEGLCHGSSRLAPSEASRHPPLASGKQADISVVLAGVGGVGHVHPSCGFPPPHGPLPRLSSPRELEGTLPCFSNRSGWSRPHLACGGEKRGGPSVPRPPAPPPPKDSGSF